VTLKQPANGLEQRLMKGLGVLLLATTLAPFCAAQATDDAAIYKQVQPVLEARCYKCHVDKMKGGLHIGTREDLLKGGDNGPAIDTAHLEKSLLLDAISYADSDLQMPPDNKLPDPEIALIQKWIHAGAPMPMDNAAAAKAAASPAAAQFSAAQEQYFENKVRPLLINRCYGCHTDGEKGGLRLDSREAVLKGGKDGTVVEPGHPDKSLLVTAVHYQSTSLKMPPSGPITPEEIGVLEQWIKDGLPWPAKDSSDLASAKDPNWWAYKKPVVTEPAAIPQKTYAKWIYNDVDKYVLAKLNEKQLKPVGDADKRTLIRRVTFDMTGLPPTPDEVAAFVADKRKDAYEHVVDRLLASKAYGERWGRIWLDVVRYADTSGNGPDFPTPEAYKYRNWVIDAFNHDMPYDEFIKEQIAGDLMPAASEPEHWQKVIATGYLAIAKRSTDAEDVQLSVSDMVDNLGYAYLGTTVACARCHDHKFDPIPTRDYYALYGILSSTHIPHPGSEDVRYPLGMVYRDPKATESPEWTTFQAQLKPIADTIAAAHLPYFDDILPQLEARRMELYKVAPKFEAAYAACEGTPHDAYIQHGGDPQRPGKLVPRGFLEALGGGPLPKGTKGSGRLELANWVANAENPLTARVMVNRIWQGNFGRGIVATPNDYGKRGLAPSNQELLDYLAVDFMRKGWSVKAMQREILLSHTYQLSSAYVAANAQSDPDDEYLWQHSRKRLDAEEIRDTMLATSGTLDAGMGGEHPFPAWSEWNWSQHRPFNAVYDTNKRTVYVMVQRSKRHPYLGLFDGADSNGSTATRGTAVTPLQALYFMNAEFPKKCAESLAASLEPAHGAGPVRMQIVDAYKKILNRAPDAEEVAHASEFLSKVHASYAAHGTADEEAGHKALAKLIEVLYASNEFMYLD